MFSKFLKIAAVAAALVSGAVSAQANENLKVTGTVAPVCQINVAGSPSSTTVIMTDTKKDQLIATLDFVCNDPDGFDVSLTSTNNCNLKSGAFSVNYEAKLGGVVDISTKTCQAPENSYAQVGHSAAFAGGVPIDLKVNLSALATAAGNYSDTIAVNIVAK